MESLNDKYVIPIEQLETPPKHLNIWGLEELGVKKALNYLLNMPGPNMKMTLCIMPKDVTEKPKKFDKVKDGQLWFVNG